MKRVLIFTFILTTFAGLATANDQGNGAFGPAGYDDRGLIVSSSGTVFVTSTVIDTSTRTATTTIKAISASGSMIWTATISNSRDLEVSGSNLISLSETTAFDGTVSSTLTAISTSSGSVAWTRTLSGRVTSLELSAEAPTPSSSFRRRLRVGAPRVPSLPSAAMARSSGRSRSPDFLFDVRGRRTISRRPHSS